MTDLPTYYSFRLPDWATSAEGIGGVIVVTTDEGDTVYALLPRY